MLGGLSEYERGTLDMRQPRGKIERLHQIHNWLRASFATPFPVKLRVVGKSELKAAPKSKMNDLGDSWFDEKNKVVQIRVGKWATQGDCIHTLIHEFAHAMTLTYPHIEQMRTELGGHDAVWGIAFSRVYAAFYDMGGATDSKLFPVRREKYHPED